MASEVHGLTAFYASRQGEAVARLVAARLAALWPALPGQSVLGLGWPSPYLGLWRDAARRVALVPAHFPSSRALAGGAGPTAVAEEAALPFADSSFDRVLLVHGLEAADNARFLLREAWRVLRDDGRLMLVVPNRVGMWAHLDRTPFGNGRPYSRGQVERLLARHLFQAERRDAALFIPPYGLRWSGAVAAPLERAGRLLCPRMAGVLLVEARKDLFGAVPLGQTAPRRRVIVEAAG